MLNSVCTLITSRADFEQLWRDLPADPHLRRKAFQLVASGGNDQKDSSYYSAYSYHSYGGCELLLPCLLVLSALRA